MIDDATRARLLDEARAASTAAYAPYSKFHVGAALLDEQGRVFTGCNVENVSYGLTICAERNAIGAAVRAGAKRIVAVAVYTPTPTPTPPCGACRQVLLEFGPAMDVVMGCKGGVEARRTMDELLPASFDQASLEAGQK